MRISGAVCEGVSFCKCKCDKKSGRNILLQDWDHTIVSDVSGMLSPFQGHNNNNNNNALPKTMQPILPGDFLPPRIQRNKAAILQPNEHEGGARTTNSSKTATLKLQILNKRMSPAMQGPLQLTTNCTHEQLPITLIPMCACACVWGLCDTYVCMYVCFLRQHLALGVGNLGPQGTDEEQR